MFEVLAGATFLIGLTLVLRCLTRGRISMKYRYSLWILVALRLLVPIPFGSSTLSVLNLSPAWTGTGRQEAREWNIPESPEDVDRIDYDRESGIGQERVQDVLQTMTEQHKQEQKAEQKPAAQDYESAGQGIVGTWQMRRMRFLMTILWMCGMAVVGGYMMVSQLRFVRYLHRKRIEVLADELPGIRSLVMPETWNVRRMRRRIRVFVVEGLPGPCLVGHDIYMEPQILKDENRLRHVMAHEYAHFIQGDALWAALRSILCAVYWFYPLVWVAGYAARRDSELACDERVIGLLGEKERFAYGRTLLDLFSGRVERIRCTGAVLIMGDRKNSMKERISMIAAKRKSSRIAAVFVALMMVLGCGCAFTGPEEADRDGAGNQKAILLTNREDPVSADTGAQAAAEEEDTIQAERHEEIKQEPQETTAGKEQTAFEQLLFSMEDTGLDSAQQVDMGQYYDYLYRESECPMEDGQWYRLPQEAESGIEFYGLYTEKYGCRGMKIEIDGDVNTFDEPWLPTYFGIKVDILEEADGRPRSFAFTECVVNSGINEIWRLYVADRYDTGTIDLYCFEEEDYRSQIEEQGISFSVTDVQEKEKAVRLMTDGTEEIGRIHISQFNDDDVEEVVWNDAAVCFIMKGEGREAITLVKGIGLKLADSDKALFGGLPLLEFPVDIGRFGERRFLLGTPEVSADYISAELDR